MNQRSTHAGTTADTTTNTTADARIAELRLRRRARLRWLAIRSGVLTLALAVVALVAVYLLFNTLRGRDVLLDQIVARLPAGTELRWSRAEGPATGPMTLYDVRYQRNSVPAGKRATI